MLAASACSLLFSSLRNVEMVPVAAGFLGPGHSLLGPIQQFVGFLPIQRVHCKSEADRDNGFLIRHRDRLGHRDKNSLRHDFHIMLARDTFQQTGKDIAAKSRNSVDFPHTLLQTVSGGSKKGIANLKAMLPCHFLQAVHPSNTTPTSCFFHLAIARAWASRSRNSARLANAVKGSNCAR